jgi:hypothetical protein
MVKRVINRVGKEQHTELIALVASVVAEWDPYALLTIGSPKDEFDAEVAAIARQLPRIRSAIDAAHVISRVFSSSFEPDKFVPQACALVGNRLFTELRRHGFVA